MRRMIAAFATGAFISTPALAQNTPRPQPQQATGTLAQVLARGHLLCGVKGSLAGFSAPDPQGMTR